MKTKVIIGIILAIALIIMSVDKIKTVNQSTSSDVNKIVWDILGVLFIIGGIGAAWTGFKALRTA